jgi:hypothetical protein
LGLSKSILTSPTTMLTMVGSSKYDSIIWLSPANSVDVSKIIENNARNYRYR